MSKYIDAECLKAKLDEHYRKYQSKYMETRLPYTQGLLDALDLAEQAINSLQQEQPKFNVGDLVVSKKNPHLTYRILSTSIPNELGKTDYKVEIFTDGKPGLLGESHNIHLISSDKIEDWGELVQQEQPELPGIEESGIPGKDFIPVEWSDACEQYGKWRIVKQEQPESGGSEKPNNQQPEVDLEEYIENEINHYGLSLYEASYGTFSASQIDRIIRNAFELGLNARKEE